LGEEFDALGTKDRVAHAHLYGPPLAMRELERFTIEVSNARSGEFLGSRASELEPSQERTGVLVRGRDQGRALRGVQKYRGICLVLGVIGQGL
jgi:hypothetical protein